MIVAGIDAGARAIKVVLVDSESGGAIGWAIGDQGTDPATRASELFERALAEQGLSEIEVAALVATGYARGAVREADSTVTEITCHARGVRHALPETRTVIELGGQDSKVVWLDEDGSVRDFSMNDRCAAGSGRFLEVLAARLQADIAELGALAAQSHAPTAINSTCVVFAENEVTGLLATGALACDVAAGALASLASRAATLVGARGTPPVVMTGGVALVSGMAEAIEVAIGLPVEVAPRPQFTGALGAALIARDGISAAGDGRPTPAGIEGRIHGRPDGKGRPAGR